MARTLQAACLCLLLAAGCFAQRGGGGFHGGSHGGGFHGGGFRSGGGYRGGGGFHSGGYRGGYSYGHSRGYIGSYGGYRHYGYHGGRYFYGGFYSGYYGWPYSWGYYGYPYYSSYYPAPYYYSQPNVTVVYAPPATVEYGDGQPAPPPSVRDDRDYRDYRQPAPAPRSSQQNLPQVYFQIATRDGSVYVGVAYWVEASTLHYIDIDGQSHDLPLAEVDRTRSEKLNAGRQIEFRLPASR